MSIMLNVLINFHGGYCLAVVVWLFVVVLLTYLHTYLFAFLSSSEASCHTYRGVYTCIEVCKFTPPPPLPCSFNNYCDPNPFVPAARVADPYS